MENLGTLAILLAFCFACYAVIGSVAGKLGRRPFLVLSAERAVYCVWALLTVAASLLVYSLIAGDFRLAYVAEHSNKSMEVPYTSSLPGGADRKAPCCYGPGCCPPIQAWWSSRIAASSAR